MSENYMFDVTRDSEKLTICFSSIMAFVDRAAEETKALLCEAGLQKHAFAVIVALREGLTNAVRHAHRSDPAKIVRLCVTLQPDKLLMVIEDQGPGFDWKAAKEKARSHGNESVLCDHGMGFTIMENYFEEFWYNKKGNKLTLLKHISA